MRYAVIALAAAVGLLAVRFLPATAQTAPAWTPKPEAGGDHDFGKKVIIVATKPTGAKDDSGGAYLVKAKVRKLGDRYFVVGELADVWDVPQREAVLWVPMSEVIQITEYDDIDAVKKVIEDARKRRGDGE